MTSPFQRFLADYGMVFVLLLLILLFSVLTYGPQDSNGPDAGTEVATRILEAATDTKPNVIVIGRDSETDRAFTEAATEHLTANGANVLATINGEPSDAKKAIRTALDAGQSIDAVAANGPAAKWEVFDFIPDLPRDKVISLKARNYPVFLTRRNLLGLANQTAIYAILAIGMTLVIITAGIDLSVGSLVALAAVTSSLVVQTFGMDAGFFGVAISILAALAACAACGLLTASMLTKFRISPFITSLALMMIASGLAFRFSGGESVDPLPPAFLSLGQGGLAGIPNPVIFMVALYAIAHIVMSRTTFGRNVYAIGGNEEAAHLSGVPVTRTLMIVYAVCGALAGFGGVILASQLGAGDPKYGVMFELYVIAAVVVGGTSLLGGSGKILGTLIGAFIISVIHSGLNQIGVAPFDQKVVIGLVLLSAILIDSLKKR